MDALGLRLLWLRDPSEARIAAFRELEEQKRLRRPGDGYAMIEQIALLDAGKYDAEPLPPSCSAYHPYQTFAMPGDVDGYCADCRAQQDTINQDARERQERSQRRRQRLIALFGTPIPDWVGDVVVMLSMDAALLFFAWNVGR